MQRGQKARQPYGFKQHTCGGTRRTGPASSCLLGCTATLQPALFCPCLSLHKHIKSQGQTSYRGLSEVVAGDLSSVDAWPAPENVGSDRCCRCCCCSWPLLSGLQEASRPAKAVTRLRRKVRYSYDCVGPVSLQSWDARPKARPATSNQRQSMLRSVRLPQSL